MLLRSTKFLSLILTACCGAWVWHSPGYDSWTAAITALIAEITLHQKDRQAKERQMEVTRNPADTAVPAEVAKNDCYASIIGSRMKDIRERYLQLTARRMSEFLNLNSVTELERYEAGVDEYPLPMLRKIEEFFFLSRDYLETGKYGAFKAFSLTAENVERFMRDGFTPYIACSPERANLFAYIAFSKKVDGYTRLAISNICGSFVSNGGGKTNIQYLIWALLEEGRSPYDVRIVTLSNDEWAAVASNSYYHESPFLRAGNADYDCIDVFDEWFKDAAHSRARWNRLDTDSAIH